MVGRFPVLKDNRRSQSTELTTVLWGVWREPFAGVDCSGIDTISGRLRPRLEPRLVVAGNTVASVDRIRGHVMDDEKQGTIGAAQRHLESGAGHRARTRHSGAAGGRPRQPDPLRAHPSRTVTARHAESFVRMSLPGSPALGSVALVGCTHPVDV